MRDVTVDTLHEILDCDAEAGTLKWKWRSRKFFATTRAHSTWNTRYAGTPALIGRSSGYLVGRIFDRCVKAHRIVWAMHYSNWPKGDIDHINGIRDDNRISNLRDVDHHKNCKNQRIRSNNSSGCTGVYWYKRGRVWVSYINVNGKTRYLGRFAKIEDAIKARQAASIKFGFHDNHGSRVVLTTSAQGVGIVEG